jgi:hypothetical protein
MAVNSEAIANGTVDLSDSPVNLDTATFDSLFPAEATTQTVTAQPQTTQQTTPPEQQQTQQTVQSQTAQRPNEPFLKGERSVYKDADAAIQGINQKDALIEQLRQRYALTTGIDPITGQPVGQQVNQQPNQLDYYNNPKAYLDNLYEAAKSSPEAYRDVQAKFTMDTLKPLQPLIERMAREQAVETLSAEIPDAKTFVGTPAYQKALDSNPELKNAITIAESDFKWHSRLPSLYKVAYYTGQGMQLPELLRAQSASPAATQTQNITQTQPVRTTAQPTTAAMPTQTAAKPSFKTLEGIRSIIANAEASGAKLEF